MGPLVPSAHLVLGIFVVITVAVVVNQLHTLLVIALLLLELLRVSDHILDPLSLRRGPRRVVLLRQGFALGEIVNYESLVIAKILK